jgi:vacuolar-type H+-ATPase subunit H
VIKLSIEELKEVVKQERICQEITEKTKEKAADIIAKSKEDAQESLQKAENQEYYEKLFSKGLSEIEEKKKNIEKKTEEKIKNTNEKAHASTAEKAVSMIVSYVLGEE